MASFRIERPDLFPNGEVVQAYAATAQHNTGGEPAGAPLSEGTVAGGAVTLTGLAEDVDYVAWLFSGGVDRYLRFRVESPAPPPAPSQGSYALEGFESIQAAIDYITAHGEGELVFPPGSTPVSSTIQLKQGVVLRGPDQEYSVNNINRMAAWLTADGSTAAPIIECGENVFNTGVWNLGITAAKHGRQAVVYDDSTKRGGNRLRNVAIKEAGTVALPALYLGQDEVRCRDVLVQGSLGDGVVIKGEDCQIDDLLCGENAGNGVVIAAGCNAARGAKWDLFTNALVGLVLNGINHKLICIQSNSNGRQGVVFAEAKSSQLMDVVIAGNGREFSTSAIRYADVEFAHPSAGNNGCAVNGGVIATYDGMESHAVKLAEKTASFPMLIGLSFEGAWNTAILSSSNCTAIACEPLSDFLVPRSAGNPILRLRPETSSDARDMVQCVTDTGVAVAGFRAFGTLYQAITEQTLEANGAVTIDAKKCNIAPITLKANATSSSISAATKGQYMTIEWVQDAVGSRTYAWPANCKFAGGAAPAASTEKAYRDSVTFRYDGTNWLEVSRSVGVR